MSGGALWRNGWLLALAGAAHAGVPYPAGAQETGPWSQGDPLLTPRRLLAAGEEGGRIYAFGGCGSPCFSPPQHVSVDEETRVEVYDPGTGRWQRRRPMPYVFFGGAAAAPGDGFVYTVGGAFSAAVVERYDPAADAWSRRARLPTPRHGLAAATIGGLIYVVGGSDGRRASGALEIYDPAADAWTRGPPMPTPRAQLAAAAVGGRLFAIGGSPDCCGGGATAVVEVYDPATGAWTAAAPLPSPRQVSAAAAIDGRLYVFGGFVPGTGVLAETLEYHPGLDRWTRLADLPTRAGEEGAGAGRDQAAVAVLGRRAVLVGGSVDCHCRALPDVVIFDPGELTADLSCTLAAPDVAAARNRVSFTLTARNDGPDAAPRSRVVLRLPPQLGDLTWSCAASPGAACPATGAGGLAVQVDLPAGGSLRFELAATVAASATCPLPTSLAVSARASTPAGVRDPRRGNDACRAEVDYAPFADLALEQETATEVPLRDRDVVFVLTASNLLGPDAACGASLTSILPPGLLEPRWTCDAPGLCTPPAGGASGLVDLLPGERATLTLTARVAADALCHLVHLAEIFPPTGIVDPVDNNNTAAAALDLALCPLPTVTKTVSPALAEEGDVVEYVVTLVNPSAVPLPDAPGDEWVDTLPPEVSPFEISADAGVAGHDGQTWRWNGALAARDSVKIRLLAMVEPGNGGLVVCNQGTFAADADADGTVELLLPSDDPALPGPTDPTCFKIPLVPPTVTKTVSPTLAAEGDVVEYVVTLDNPSAVPLPDGPGDEWVDTLPPEVSPFEISADAGVAELDGQTWRWNGALAARDSVEIRLLAVVEPGNAGLVVCNQGALFADAEPDDMVDPLPIKSDDPSLPGSEDPTCFEIEPEDDDEPVGPFPIPALGGAGRPLVVVLIAVVGVIVLRRWGRPGLRGA